MLSNSCLVLPAVVKQHQGEISGNHVPSLFGVSVFYCGDCPAGFTRGFCQIPQIKRPTHFYDAGFRRELRPPPSTVAIKADGCGQPATISHLFIFLLACRRSGNQPYNYYQQQRNRLACPIPAAMVVMQAGRHAGRPGPDHGGMASSIPWYTR